MKWLALLLVVLAVAAPPCEGLKRGLRAKFNIGLRPGTDFFFDVPRTVVNAVSEGWSITSRADSTRPDLVLYCPEDRVLCGFFTRTGRIAGLQIALAQDEFSDAKFDWETQGYTEWTPTPLSGEEQKTYMTTQIFFVSQDSSDTDVDTASTTDEDEVLVEGAVWVTGFNKQELQISAVGEEVENSVFTKQACIPLMGQHYYYNMSKTTECTADGIFPWFPLVNSGRLEALGFLIVGKLELIDGRRDWFERPPKLAVQMIVPNGPDCLYDLASDPGVVTMHIYFTDEPWRIGCPLFG